MRELWSFVSPLSSCRASKAHAHPIGRSIVSHSRPAVSSAFFQRTKTTRRFPFMHLSKETARRVLSDAQRDQFVHEGFVKLANAFPAATAAAARAILWQRTGCDPEDRKTWTRPVIRLGDFAQEPFREATNTAVMHTAFDELVGVGRWVPRASVGGFPIRFPHRDDPGDTGWHVDASFPPDQAVESPDRYFDWRVNLRSKGRVCLCCCCFRTSVRRTRRHEFDQDHTCRSRGC